MVSGISITGIQVKQKFKVLSFSFVVVVVSSSDYLRPSYEATTDAYHILGGTPPIHAPIAIHVKHISNFGDFKPHVTIFLIFF